ncbi:MAG: hypothetical protein ACI8UR_001305 [Natronomonas sp.]|jgi:hypothetical protein|uniref:hypothetical protein n=1 Tax=Natronomonas sp. TaxID=2184060 RepID=UPI0039897179
MRLIPDNRGVSEVVGAILVFGILIALLSILQTQAIPAANQQIEFNHNQEAQGDLVKFHQTASEVSNTGQGESVRIQTGTGYPSRLLFYSPSAATGRLATTDNRTVRIENATATEPEVRQYMSGRTLRLNSRNFEYSVSYNYLDNAPTTRYEYGILYNNFSDATIIKNPGSVVDDTDINLIFMSGNYSDASASVQSLDVRPNSAPARPVTIEGSDNGNDNITLELPTQMPLSTWEELVSSQDTVLNVSKPANDTVRIALNGSERYTLRMSRLSLEPGVEKPDAHYIVPADDGTTSVGVGQTTNVKYEVRDEYNNPVSGTDVDITYPNGTTVRKTTDGEGRVVTPLTPTDGGSESVNASIDTSGCNGAGAPARCQATYTVQVSDLSINPGSGVRFVNASVVTGSILLPPLLSTSTDGMEVNFKTTSPGSTRDIARMRMNFYGGQQDQPANTSLYNPGQTTSNEPPAVGPIEIGGKFYDRTDSQWRQDPATIDDDGTKYRFYFTTSDGSSRTVEDGDFFVLTVVFDGGERAIYFVSPD